MFCSSCGKEIEDEVKFCEFCGKSVHENTNKLSVPTYEKSDVEKNPLFIKENYFGLLYYRYYFGTF